MNFGIKRLANETDATVATTAAISRQYHLFDGAGTLIMVADQGSPWLTENRYHVRFARPDGQPMAVLDWPEKSPARQRHGLSERSYAIVLDDAVFAILTAYCRPVGTAVVAEPSGAAAADAAPVTVPVSAPAAETRLAYMTVDVGESRFLVLPPAGGAPGAEVYVGVPAGLAFYGQVERDKLPAPVGHLNTAISYTYIAELPPRTFPREELLVLAIAYLLDDACQPSDAA